MKKLLFAGILIAIFFVALFIVAVLDSDYGYVKVLFDGWSYEESLSSTLGLLLLIFTILFIVFYFSIRLFLQLYRLPKSLRHRRQRRSAERSRRNIITGLIELSEGHWEKAETILLKHIDGSDTPLLNYLLAARAAQQQDADERRDEYLKQAHEITPEADVAIGLTQAELQLAHGQTERALATLTRLRDIAPKHAYVLKLLSKLYVQLNEWEKLAALLPEIRKRKIVTGDKLLELERMTYTHFIRFIAKSSAIFDLEEQWKILPKRYREDAEIFRVYVSCLLDNKKYVAAERQLRGFLNKHWDESLIQLYAHLQVNDINKLLDNAEAWLKDHGRSPMLLLTLARLSHRLQLWGKSRVYYESSIALHASVEAYAELAELLESLGETDSAHEAFRKGLALSTSRSHTRRASDYNKAYGLSFANSIPSTPPAANQIDNPATDKKFAAIK